MKPSFILSIIFHISCIALMYFGLPDFLPEPDVKTDFVITADIVTVAEVTNVIMKSQHTVVSKDEIKKAPKSIDEPAVNAPKEEAPKPSLPEKPADPVKEIVPEVTTVVKPKELPKPIKKPPAKEELKKKKKKDDSFERSILKSLDESAKKKQEKKVEKDFSDLEKALIGDTNLEFNKDLPMTMSELDAIRAQIVSNWNLTSFSGAVGAKDFRVVIVIELDSLGDIISVKPKDQNSNSPHYRAFVESGIRAVKLSSPLKNLNPEKFGTWKNIELNFDAKDLIY